MQLVVSSLEGGIFDEKGMFFQKRAILSKEWMKESKATGLESFDRIIGILE